MSQADFDPEIYSDSWFNPDWDDSNFWFDQSTPTTLTFPPSASLHYDPADSRNTITSGAMQTLFDLSGNARTSDQATAGSRPTVTVDGTLGRNVMVFGGSHLLTQNSGLLVDVIGSTTWTVVAEVKVTSNPATADSTFWTNQNFLSGDQENWGFAVETGAVYQAGYFDTGFVGHTWPTLSGALSTWQMVHNRKDASVDVVGVNNVEGATANISAIATRNVTVGELLQVGRGYPAAGSGNFFIGSLGRVIVYPRSLSSTERDTIKALWGYTQTNYTAAISETVTLSEANAALLAAIVPVSETVTLSEALASLYAAVAGLSEAVTFTEVLTALKAASITLAETVTLSESGTFSVNFPISLSESSGSITDALSVLYAAITNLSETVANTEALAALYVTSIALAETVSLAESLAAVFSTSIALSESSGSVTDSLVALYGAVAGLSETVSLAEAQSTQYIASGNISETVTFTEALVAVYSTAIALNESLGLVADSLTSLMAVSISLSSSSGSVSDSLTSLYGANIALADNEALSEAAVAAVAANAAISESMSVSDSESPTYSAFVALADTLSPFSESINVTGGTAGITINLAETVGWTENVAASYSAIQQSPETVVTSESVGVVAAFPIAITSSSGSVSDSLTSLYGATIPWPESVNTSESVAAHATSTIAIAETASLAEALLASMRAVIPVADSLSLSENIAQHLAASVTLFEAPTYIESVTVSASTAVGLVDSLSVLDTLQAVVSFPIQLVDDSGAITERLILSPPKPPYFEEGVDQSSDIYITPQTALSIDAVVRVVDADVVCNAVVQFPSPEAIDQSATPTILTLEADVDVISPAESIAI